jgi:recombinational DNA repair ATPase RecF
VVSGENGAGKTSMLEAIAYGSALRSFRNSPRESLVRTGASSATVRMEVTDGWHR